jgi:uncharacterized repeat protein (TIGR04138 family)
LNRYPVEAFEFLQQGLNYSVGKIHGPKTDSEINRHITGQQLCEGLRDYARQRWGLMARTVLSQWNLRGTSDFGRMVFALVDNGLLHKTDDDTMDDFCDVYDFKVLDQDYPITCEKKIREVGA